MYDATNFTAVLLGAGSKDIFFRKTGSGSNLTVYTLMDHVKMRIVYNSTILDATNKLFKSSGGSQNIALPPDWAFGQFVSVKGLKDFSEI